MSKRHSNKAAEKNSGFCIYLGPTIPRVIQKGTIFPAGRESALKMLAAEIAQHPLIAPLLIERDQLAEHRIKIKTPGNLLYVLYNKLAAGEK